MDTQTLFNLVGGAAIGASGWFARRVWDAMDRMSRDHADLREELPKTYATKNDLKDSLREVRELLERIDAKLDKKVDRHEAR